MVTMSQHSPGRAWKGCNEHNAVKKSQLL